MARDGRWKAGVIKLFQSAKGAKLFPVMLVGQRATKIFRTESKPLRQDVRAV